MLIFIISWVGFKCKYKLNILLNGGINMVHEAMMPSNYTASGGGYDGDSKQGYWVFALVIIFLTKVGTIVRK